MGKKLFALMIMASLCFTVAGAEEPGKKSSGITDWLKNLQHKINMVAPKKSAPAATGVAGVRGAKEDAQVKLYWKGRKGEESVTEEELNEFKQGIDLAAKGDKTSAIKEIEEFMKQYPDSALIPDAKKTLDMVKTE